MYIDIGTEIETEKHPMATVCCGFNDCTFKVHSCTAIFLAPLKFNGRIFALLSQMCLCASRVTAYHSIVAGGCVRAIAVMLNSGVPLSEQNKVTLKTL